LRCEIETGTWWQLRMIDRPVVMKFTSANGQSVYGVLLAMDEKKALINFAGEELLLNKNQVTAYWEGEYYLLWKIPPNYQHPLSMTMSGVDVQWLLTTLAKLENLDLIVPPNAVFDEKLKTRIEKFQVQHSLRADGVAGPYTLIALNSLTNANIPRLSNPMGAN